MSSRRREGLQSGEMLPWLPDEILYLIIRKLMVFPASLARFSAICKRWRRLICDAWPKLALEYQITPLIIVPVTDCNEEEGAKQVYCRIYNLIGDRAPAPVNPLPSVSTIIGSSFGWLIITDGIDSVSLFNPLSKTLIPLPPLPMHRLYGADPQCEKLYLVKAVLSKPPPRPDQEDDQHYYFDVAVTIARSSWTPCNTATMIAYLHKKKTGALHWVWHRSSRDRILDANSTRILDVNSIGGRICILLSNGLIICCKCTTDRVSFCTGVRKAWPSTTLDGNPVSVYLLESSSSSEPLVVFRYKQEHSSPSISRRPFTTVGFKILALTSSSGNDDELKKPWNWTDDKLNPNAKSVLNWTEVKTLGNDVIFLGDNASFCIQAAGNSELLHQPAAGSIYYTDEEYDHPFFNLAFHYPDHPPDFDVFNIDQNCLTYRASHRPDDSTVVTELIQRPPPTWLLLRSYDKILKFSSIG